MLTKKMTIAKEFFKQISALVRPLRIETFSNVNFCELKLKSDELIKIEKCNFLKVFGKKRTTICRIKKIDYGYKDNTIHLPYKVREKCGIQNNEFIRIQKFHCKPAEYIKIIPINIDLKPTKNIIKLTREQLLDNPLIKNDIISIDIGFQRELHFKILDIQPTSPALISPETIFVIELSYFKEMKIKADIIANLMI